MDEYGQLETTNGFIMQPIAYELNTNENIIKLINFRTIIIIKCVLNEKQWHSPTQTQYTKCTITKKWKEKRNRLSKTWYGVDGVQCTLAAYCDWLWNRWYRFHWVMCVENGNQCGELTMAEDRHMDPVNPHFIPFINCDLCFKSLNSYCLNFEYRPCGALSNDFSF